MWAEGWCPEHCVWPSSRKMSCWVDSDAATDDAPEDQVGGEDRSGQRWFRFRQCWGSCAVSFRDADHVGTSGLEWELSSFTHQRIFSPPLGSGCSLLPSILLHTGLNWLLSSSVGWILYLELCFRNTHVMWLWKKKVDTIFSCLEVCGGWWSLWQTGVCCFRLDPKRSFCYSRQL